MTRRLLAAGGLSLVAIGALPAQSPLVHLAAPQPSKRESVAGKEVTRSDTSRRSGLWSGAAFAYDVARGGEAAERLTVGAQMVFDAWRPLKHAIWRWTFSMPVVGNLARPQATEAGSSQDALRARALEIAGSAQGLYAGVSPSFSRGFDNGYGVSLHIIAQVRANTLKPTEGDSTVTLQHGRLGIGTVVNLADFSTGPGQLNIELTRSRFAADAYERVFGERRTSTWNLEASLILPIGQGVGLMASISGRSASARRGGGSALS